LELENQLEAERTKSNKFLEEIENEAKVEKKDSGTPAKLYVHTECENSSKENIPPKETLTPSEKPKKKKGIQDKGKDIDFFFYILS